MELNIFSSKMWIDCSSWVAFDLISCREEGGREGAKAFLHRSLSFQLVGTAVLQYNEAWVE